MVSELGSKRNSILTSGIRAQDQRCNNHKIRYSQIWWQDQLSHLEGPNDDHSDTEWIEKALGGLQGSTHLIALRGFALWGTTLQGSLAAFGIEDFWSKVEIVKYGVAQKSFGYKLIGPKMIQPIISFLSLRICSWAKLLLFHAAQPLQTYRLHPCFIYVALGQQLPHPNRGWDHGPWQQAKVVASSFWPLTLPLSFKVLCYVWSLHLLAVMEHYEGFYCWFYWRLYEEL